MQGVQGQEHLTHTQVHREFGRIHHTPKCAHVPEFVAVGWTSLNVLEDGKMTFLLLLAVLGIGFLLYRIDGKLQAIGDMMNEAAKSEEPRRLNS